MDINNLVLEQMAIIDYLTRKSGGAEWNALELEQLPSGWEAMDQLLYRVRAVTFSWNNTFWLGSYGSATIWS